MCARSRVSAIGSTLSSQCSTLQLKVLHSFQKLDNSFISKSSRLGIWSLAAGSRRSGSENRPHSSPVTCVSDCTASAIMCERWARPYEAQKWKPCSEEGCRRRMEAKKPQGHKATSILLILTIISTVLSTARLPGWCVKLIIIAYKEMRGRKWGGGGGWACLQT